MPDTSTASTKWDANLYLKFADARMRPALDLMARLDPASLGHRLTPDYSLAVLASGQASAGGSQSTRLRSLNVNLTGKVGSKSALTLGARRVVSSGTTPYAESAVTGNLNVSF